MTFRTRVTFRTRIKNCELRIKNWLRRHRGLLRLSFLILNSQFLILLVVPVASANDLTVDKRSLRLNDLLTITLSLEGDFAGADSINIPLRNLVMVGEPWVSSEFSWISGQVVRRKVFRYRARPVEAGPAMVGPVVIDDDQGRRALLDAIALDVAADRASASNNPEAVLRELTATGRDPFFIVAELDKTSAFVGEQIVVTWTLYNAANVQQWQITSVPKLQDFWSEEIDVRRSVAQQEFVGGVLMQRIPIRRVVVYPLRSGRFQLGGMTLEAAVMRRIRRGPFAMFEGNLVEVAYTSAPATIDVKPIPPGPPVDVVGDVRMTCLGRSQARGGPVTLEVRMHGAGNLRAAAAPRFESRIDGTVQIENGVTGILNDEGVIQMTRPWKYLIFPRRSGLLDIPPLVTRAFHPGTGQRFDLRCEVAPIEALVATTTAPPTAPPAVRREQRTRRALPWLAGAVLFGLFIALVIPRLRRELRLRARVRDLTAGTPAEIRERIDAIVPSSLLTDRSDRGDAYRALRSLLDAMERDRDLGENAEQELERRVRELLLASGR